MGPGPRIVSIEVLIGVCRGILPEQFLPLPSASPVSPYYQEIERRTDKRGGEMPSVPDDGCVYPDGVPALA